MGARRAHHELGPWAWHEHGGDVALGWITLLITEMNGDGSSCRHLFPLVQVGRLAGGFGRGEDMSLGHVTWHFSSYKMLLF